MKSGPKIRIALSPKVVRFGEPCRVKSHEKLNIFLPPCCIEERYFNLDAWQMKEGRKTPLALVGESPASAASQLIPSSSHSPHAVAYVMLSVLTCTLKNMQPLLYSIHTLEVQLEPSRKSIRSLPPEAYLPPEAQLLARENRRRPLQALGMYPPPRLLQLLLVLLHDARRQAYAVLTLVVAEEAKRHAAAAWDQSGRASLESRGRIDVRIHDIRLGDERRVRDLLDAHVVAALHEIADDDLRPVGAIAEQTQITERLLRAARLLLLPAQSIGKLDEQLPEPMTLMLRQREDTGNVVSFGALLLFREVAHHVASCRITLGLQIGWTVR